MRRFLLSVSLAVPLLALGAPVGAAPEEEEGVQVVAPIELPETDDGQRTVRDWYALGGWIMHLLVGCSIVTFALVVERAWSLRRNSVIPRKFLTQIRDHWHRREIPEVLTLCAASNTAIARVLRAGLVHFDEGMTRVEDAIETLGAHEHTLLRRNLSLLSALGNIATMLGLLGTVLGMIDSFDLIAKTGTGDARVVAGGIFKALVTTAAGLMVGIFAVAMHSYFKRKVEILAIDLEDISFRLVETLASDPEPTPMPKGDLAPAEA
ncbi:MAG: MotA/TolQ/ExbB proton channel family protein [Myxococcota bacterium]